MTTAPSGSFSKLSLEEYKGMGPHPGIGGIRVPNNSDAAPGRGTHPLTGANLLRFNSFFENRRYEYRAQLSLSKNGPVVVELRFPFEFRSYLQSCIKQMQANGIEVTGAYVKGGAVLQNLTGVQKHLADLDIVIEIVKPKNDNDWGLVEQAVFSPLTSKERGDIQWQDRSDHNGRNLRSYFQGGKELFTIPLRPNKPHDFFSCRGAKSGRYLDQENKDFAIYSIPTYFEGREQEIDVHVVARSSNSCFCSADCFQIDLGDLDQLFKKPSFRAVGGYDFDESLRLLEKRKFNANCKKVKTLNEGLRGFCRITTKGYSPDDMNFERFLWESYLEQNGLCDFESKSPQIQKDVIDLFDKKLSGYLKKHYHHNQRGKINYLLNYYETFLRLATESEDGVTSKKLIAGKLKQTIERVIAFQLYDAAGLKMPDDLEKIRSEVHAIQSYFYLQAKEKTTYSHNRQRYFFVEADNSDFLLFRDPKPRFELLRKQMDKDLESYALLQMIVGGDLNRVSKVFSSQALESRPALIKKRGGDVVESEDSFLDKIVRGEMTPPRAGSEDYDQFVQDLQDQIIEQLNARKVALPNKALIWGFENGLFSSETCSEFIYEVFDAFCFMESMGIAQRLLRYMLSRKEPIFIECASCFASYISLESDAQEFIGILSQAIQSKRLDWAQAQSTIDVLVSKICKEFPKQIELLTPLIQRSPVDFQRKVAYQLLENKNVAFFFMKQIYDLNGESLFIDYESGELSFELIRAFMDALISKNKGDEAIYLYGKIEKYVLSSSSFPEIFGKLMTAACLSKNKEATPLIQNGFREILNNSRTDSVLLKALTTLSKFPNLREQVDEGFHRCVDFFAVALNNKEGSEDDLANLVSISKSIRNPKPKKVTPPIAPPQPALEKFMGDKKGGLKHYRNLLASEDQNMEIWNEFYKFSLSNGCLEEFKNFLVKSCQKNPTNKELRILLNKYYDQQIQNEEDLYASNTQILESNGYRMHEDKRHLFDEMEEKYISKLTSNLTLKLSVLEELRHMEMENSKWANQHGEVCLRLGNVDGAVASFTTASIMDPSNELYKDNLKKALAGTETIWLEDPKTNEEYIAELDRMIESNPNDERNWEQCLNFSDRHGILDAFREKLIHKCNENKGSEILRCILVNCNEKLSHTKENGRKYLIANAALYVELRKINPKNPWYPYRYGEICQSFNKTDKAIEAYKIAIEIDPKPLEFSMDLAEILIGQNQPGAATKVLMDYSDLEDVDLPKKITAILQAAEYRGKVGRRFEEKQALQKALKLDPKNIFVLQKYAEFCAVDDPSSGEAVRIMLGIIESQKAAQRPVEEIDDSYIRLGAYYLKSSEPWLAAENFEKVIPRRPELKDSEDYANAILVRLKRTPSEADKKLYKEILQRKLEITKFPL